MYRVNIIIILFAAANLTASSDQLLHQSTSYDQKDVSVAVKADSGVVVWNSYNQDSSSGGIFGKVLDLKRTAAAAEFQVNEISEGNQGQPDVCLRPDNSFAVCWRSPWASLESENIMVRFFDANAVPVTQDILVNQYTDGDQRLPRITALSSGHVAVAWESLSYPDRSKRAVCCRVFDANGLAVTDEFLVTDQAYAARNVDIAENTPGQLIVIWLNDRTENSVWARSFNGQGLAVADAFQVNESSFKTLTWPRISANRSGQYAIAWDGDPNTGAQDDIHIRFFDANSVPLSPDYRLNASTDGAQQNPTISVNDQLCALVAWESDHLFEDQGQEVMTRFIDVNGLACGPEISIPANHIGNQTKPSVGMTSRSQFVLAWESSLPEINNTDIYYCLGQCPSMSDMNADSYTDFVDFSLWAQSWPQDAPDSVISLSDANADLSLFCSEWLMRSIKPSDQ
ncbi:MAG: hypothetical protein K9N55_00650 [Phycisphaerae bacterium]|nr:hypothetical protein [Phycisphaerae bacterium]